MCSNDVVLCLFCNEGFPSSTLMSEHLMMCGNKTDQCPECKRFVRRAIFAYHYENNCTNLDDITDPDKSKSNSANNKIENHNGTTMFDNQKSEKLQQTRTSSIIICQYCSEDCHKDDYKIHKKKCLYNPKNIEKRQQKQNTANSNQGSSLLNQHKNNNDIIYIPCQFCNELLESNKLKDHQIACNEQKKRREEEKRRNNQIPVAQCRCLYCEKECNNTQDLQRHQINCYRNPEKRSYAAVASGYSPLSSN